MQVVINIPQKLYRELTTVTVTHAGEVFAQKLIGYIKNGTPLPKGHGRLIDADSLKEEMEKDVRRAMSFVDLTDFVWLAPTIIEADREV